MNPRKSNAPADDGGEAKDQVGAGSDPSVGATSDTLLSFAQCLDLLGLGDDELLSFLTKGKDAPDAMGRQYDVGMLKALDLDAYADMNVWCGLQPMRRGAKRGKADDVVRLVALFADLDIGQNKIPDVETLRKILEALSGILGVPPLFIIASGHGFQPIWAILREDTTDVERLKVLLKKWGKLVQQIAREHNASADSVFDAARVLRVPGTTNWKQINAPVPATALHIGGAPISADQIEEAIDLHLKPEPKPTKVTTRATGTFTAHQGDGTSCRYATSMLQGWALDNPDERHPWATRNGLKLAALKKLGCVSDSDYQAGVETLVQRMAGLCARAGDARHFDRTEIVGTSTSIMETAESKVAGYSDAQLRTATGDHSHADPEDLSWIPQWTGPDAPKRSDLVPEVHPGVYHGLIGDYVREVAPATESDPLAILVQCLTWYGCKIGRTAWIKHGNVTHYPLLWPLIVGRTSTGRKGNSEADSLSSLSSLSSLPRRRSGLSSGEGLIEAFMAKKPDEAPPDYRMIVVETEWESVLARTRREGNTLSAQLRDAWDGRTLATMNAGGASREVSLHALAVVGHITPQALREGMTGTDLTNGFLNRFLPIAVHRPHLVPWPEPMTDSARNSLSTIATKKIDQRGAFHLSPAAKDLYVAWYAAYSSESDKASERVAMATGRAVPNLLRAALIYAHLDSADNVIEVQHLVAAMALVNNSRASAQLLLAPGKAGLDARILQALREHGPMSRSELSNHFNRHVPADQLAEALDALVNSGEVLVEKKTDTGGRPSETYRAVAKKAKKAS